MSAITRTRILLLIGASMATVQFAIASAATWIYVMAFDREFDVADAPTVPVALVLGSKVSDGEPGSYVRGRLDSALELYREGRVQQILNSGNGDRAAGDEPQVMRSYLEQRGVPAGAIIDDPEGFDTAESCRRARDVYDVEAVLIVTQDFHLARAIGLCRDIGIDARGVYAECECAPWTVARNHIRETVLAGPRALLTSLTN
ncbi:SanA/YdcF family protein [Williamsia soli]|uniref:SanA/YdcF family protein n=1 Tax=Williamsia soli TaxID=364929 RepID=UPI001A9CF687|nr:ElyC/SanA/YdcF family protein [Williamsia soli]